MDKPFFRLTKRRFPLIHKLVVGSAVVTLFTIAAVFYFFFPRSEAFKTGEDKFQSYQLSQYLEKLFQIQSDAAEKFFNTGDTNEVRTLKWLGTLFHDTASSHFRQTEVVLQEMEKSGADELQIRSLKTEALQMQLLLSHHKRYSGFVQDQIMLNKKKSANREPRVSPDVAALRDSVMQTLRTINQMSHSSLLKALRFFFQHKPFEGWAIIIGGGIIFLIALAVSLLFAQTITRPIRALKAGTEKVGEGNYETVPITTTDEVADLTQAFNLMSTKLKQLDEMRMQMMSEISHEMRTPLQVIKAGCYSISHSKDGPPLTQRQKDALGMMHQATNRINAFVNSFLDVAKMEAGLMKFNFEPTNLIELLNPLVQEAQLIAQTRQIHLDLKADEIPIIQLDRERMTQVVSNLLSNALKYTPDNGTIKVRIAKMLDCNGVSNNNRGCVKIDVEDSGVGIPETDLNKLFKKFYQAKNVPLVNEKGSGLGLALVKHVAEAHGGQVSVKSQVGVGSTFSVLLPA
ncbi:MAG: HAMP domain-containing histidine kinase [Ignavibacteriae bacterium]|nr:HAMP domain-containing histidine kinase [Ignavibacteriota bacterium]